MEITSINIIIPHIVAYKKGNTIYSMRRLKEIRLAKNLKQSELAKQVGVNYRTISSYETGARDMPVSVAKKIGKVLNIDWWILYEG